jgi:hypothetical protein
VSTKHLFVIHGSSTKPQRRVLERLVKRAITEGLRRVDSGAAGKLEASGIRFTLVYYGDITNELMVRAEPELKKSMIQRGGRWYQPHNSDEMNLERLIAWPTRKHSQGHYKELIRKTPNRRLLDHVARVVSPVASVMGLGPYAIRRLFPDLAAYLNSRAWGSELRTRLQGPLRRALARGEDVALVSHSMGCIVSYDVLWKLSRMSEYRSVHDRKVSLWLTLGNPLGEPTIKAMLYDANEPNDGLFPANLVDWVNIAAQDDLVARDRTVADDFQEMIRRKLLRRIKDHRRIYSFWVGARGSNPHKSYGYFNHPSVARVLARWIQ